MNQNERFKWFTEPDDILAERIVNIDKCSVEERVKRLKFLYEEFGPETGMLFYGGMPAMVSFIEMRAAYINAIELSVIVCAHVFTEQTLGSMLIFGGFDADAEGGLYKIIKRSMSEGYIDQRIADRLDKLRRMRIAYFHPHVGLKERSYMGRRISNDYYDDAEMLKKDSKEAIRIVVDLLRFLSPDHKPGVLGDHLGN